MPIEFVRGLLARYKPLTHPRVARWAEPFDRKEKLDWVTFGKKLGKFPRGLRPSTKVYHFSLRADLKARHLGGLIESVLREFKRGPRNYELYFDTEPPRDVEPDEVIRTRVRLRSTDKIGSIAAFDRWNSPTTPKGVKPRGRKRQMLFLMPSRGAGAKRR